MIHRDPEGYEDFLGHAREQPQAEVPAHEGHRPEPHEELEV
jgi:hypothetical protein